MPGSSDSDISPRLSAKHADVEMRKTGSLNFETWVGNQKFYFEGRLMTGPKIGYLITTVASIFTINFTSFSYSFLSMAERGVVFPSVLFFTLWISNTFFIVTAACRNPGLIPKKKHDQPRKDRIVLNGLGKSHWLEMKYCKPCGIMELPRS